MNFHLEDHAHSEGHSCAEQVGTSTEPNPRQSAAGKYTCPMHPEIISNEPGSCPICGMALEPIAPTAGPDDQTELKDMTRRLWIGALLAAPVLILAMGQMVPGLNRLIGALGQSGNLLIQFLLSTPVYFWAGRPFLERAWKSVLNRTPNMFTLISLGTTAAYLFSVLQLIVPVTGHTSHPATSYFEAAAVITVLALLGQVLELRARSKTGSAIRSLLELSPRTASRVVADKEEEIPLEQVHAGDILRVRPGDRVPVDGILLEGNSDLNEAMITGEPMPVTKKAGDTVIGGTVNGSGSFIFRAERVGGETLLAQIVDLVAKAQRSQAPVQRIADKVSEWFVPAVLLLALITFAGWLLFGPEPRLSFAFSAAVAVLIIACPCALGLATPMAVMVGVGRGAQLGILVRDAAVLEELEKINVVAFDKTGTLTEGNPKVVETVAFKPYSQSEVLQLAAAVESLSEHPLGRAIVRAAGNQALPKATAFEATVGSGVRAEVDSHVVYVGKSSSDEAPENVASAAANRWRREGKTAVVVLIDNQPAGLIAIADTLKRNSASAVKRLHDLNIRSVMLTGDNKVTARSIAEAAGIDDVIAEVSPEQKQKEIAKLQASGAKVAMAGDGINDAPALATANVGIAMGTGTEVAIESAGITLVKGDLDLLVSAILLSRETMKKIRENLVFAFIYNFLGVPVAAGILYPVFGLLLSPMIASVAMSLSSVSVIANSLRLRNSIRRQA
ncbi:MAG TPA: copper-translocating P-type ATPase [Chthoniobacterales bacterium]|nr:copper-translocating P-type ATPase [Chthoniobacterales bacterium]